MAQSEISHMPNPMPHNSFISASILFLLAISFGLPKLSQGFVPYLAPCTARTCRSQLRMAVNEAPKNGVANKVALVALGCPKNTVDAEVMLGDLQKRGFSIVRQPKDADVGEILLTFKHLVVKCHTKYNVTSRAATKPISTFIWRVQLLSTHVLSSKTPRKNQFRSPDLRSLQFIIPFFLV